MKFVVVGGGAAGLYTAIVIARRGHVVDLLEKSPKMGGRIRSTTEGGEVLDHGAWRVSKSHKLLCSFLDRKDLVRLPSGIEKEERTDVPQSVSKFALSGLSEDLESILAKDILSGYQSSSSVPAGKKRHSGTYYEIKGGFYKLIDSLKKQIKTMQMEGHEIHVHRKCKAVLIHRPNDVLTIETPNGKFEPDRLVLAAPPRQIQYACCLEIQKCLRPIVAAVEPLPLMRIYGHSESLESKDTVTFQFHNRQIFHTDRLWQTVSYCSGMVASAWNELLTYFGIKKIQAHFFPYTRKLKYFFYPEGTHKWIPAYAFDYKRVPHNATWVTRNISIVGEAVSDTQGWTEGALRSVHLSMATHPSIYPEKYMVYRGRILDVSGWFHRHPGGEDLIKKYLYQDITDVFDRAHLTDMAYRQLLYLQVGVATD